MTSRTSSEQPEGAGSCIQGLSLASFTTAFLPGPGAGAQLLLLAFHFRVPESVHCWREEASVVLWTRAKSFSGAS